MLTNVLTKIFGSANDRTVKKYSRIVEQINALEPAMIALTDEELQGQTFKFKERLANGETLDSLKIEAFATVREASKRVLKMRPFDVQLTGGLVLHDGMISEQKTGEGKTLVATLPIYLNALTGKGVHLITVNDYLVQRDAAWMGQIYNFLGLSVGCIIHGLSDNQRRAAYNSDITYGTNHEFGFDYLRDNMKFRFSDLVMRPFNYAIVDEVDSILIDEARTPLIISGSAEDSSDLYKIVNEIIPMLTKDHYEKDEKQRNVTLNEAGIEKIEELLREANLIKGEILYDVQNISLVHHVNQALKAHVLFTRDVDYIVKDDKVIIVDEFTGRMMEGRRYSEGLHQALEAKENVTVEMENQTLASITYQNFFRLYPKLSGMTGTAMTEASEFEEIYKLRTVEIPTNKPVQRKDEDDEVYLTAKEKYNAMVIQIKECQDRNQPVLVGTTSIEKSELISSLLTKENIQHSVLNARYHEQEANIIVNAGAPGAVTIATNMAGRGTDIKLGGNIDALIEKEVAGVESESERQKIIERVTAEHKDLEDQVVAGTYEKRVAKCKAIITDLIKKFTNLNDQKQKDATQEVLKKALKKKEATQEVLKKALESLNEISEKSKEGDSDPFEIFMGELAKKLSHSQETKSLDYKFNPLEIYKTASGLYVIGTERHESRRVDNQLRGRSGRQGDPGASKFYISLEDDLMRIFGSDRLDSMLRRLGVEEGEAISHSWISKALERAQQKVEARNFDIRKHLLRYDDVMNDQRKIIYEQRKDLMKAQDISEMIADMRSDVVEGMVHRYIPENSLSEQWDIEGLKLEVFRILGLDLDIQSWANEEGIAETEITHRILAEAEALMTRKEEKYSPDMIRSAESNLVLRILDQCWKEHLLMLDHLRQGINLRAYAQSNPLNEYKREAFILFQEMLDRLREETILTLCHFEIDIPDPDALSQYLAPQLDFEAMQENTPDWATEDLESTQDELLARIKAKAGTVGEEGEAKPKRTRKRKADSEEEGGARVQRNAQCPCGSGKKFKHCHGAIEL